MAKTKIAIVEDDKTLSKYLSSSFRTDPLFEVLTADDGEAGVDLVKTEKPAIVLLDIIMPIKNGFEVLEAIKANDETKDIPVIMLSNLSQQSDIDQAMKLGATDFFVKVDYEPQEIIDKIKKILKM